MGNVFTRPVRYVERDERGRVTKRTRFGKGDSPEGVPDSRVEQFLRSGTLVDEAKYNERQGQGGGSSDVVVTAAALSGLTADPGLRDGGEHQHGAAGGLQGTQAEESGDVSDVEAPAGATGEGQSDDSGNADDDYSSMTVAELQDEADSRDLSKSGTKAELQARLREDDNA